MSVASVTDADYATVVQDLRGHLGAGTSQDAEDMRLALAVVKHAAGKSASITTLVAAVRTAWDAFATPDAGTEAAIAALETAMAAWAPTYWTNPVADG